MRLNDDMPQIDGETLWLHGQVIEKEDLLGKPTLFHFWSISCDECKIALPKINQLKGDYQEDLNMIAIHMPRSEDDLSIDIVESVSKAYEIFHPIVIDNDHFLTDLFSVNYVPAYFVFDASGKLRYYQSGSSNIRTLIRRIERLI